MGASPQHREPVKPVCLITGAAGRLGTALCRAFALDYHVVATYRNAHPLVSSQLQRSIEPRSGRGVHQRTASVYSVQADLTRREDLRRLVEVAIAKYGQVDAVINAAANMNFHGKLIEMWQIGDSAISQLVLNCFVPIQLVSLIYESCWKDQPKENAAWKRSVVNVSSMCALGDCQMPDHGFYSASKAALNTLTLYLSSELASYSVRANGVCPPPLTGDNVTEKVIDAIRTLIQGDDTGSIVSKF